MKHIVKLKKIHVDDQPIKDYRRCTDLEIYITSHSTVVCFDCNIYKGSK